MWQPCPYIFFFNLQHELVNLDNLECSYHDETLAAMGLTPSEIELVIPRFVKRDRARDLEYWSEQMAHAVDKLELSEFEASALIILLLRPEDSIYFL
jgi:hypothetical protein